MCYIKGNFHSKVVKNEALLPEGKGKHSEYSLFYQGDIIYTLKYLLQH